MTITYFLVIGRICGDDEDTPRTYELDCNDVNEAIRVYEADMKDSYIESAIESGGEIDPDIEVFINYVFSSASPIDENWNRWVWGLNLPPHRPFTSSR